MDSLSSAHWEITTSCMCITVCMCIFYARLINLTLKIIFHCHFTVDYIHIQKYSVILVSLAWFSNNMTVNYVFFYHFNRLDKLNSLV